MFTENLNVPEVLTLLDAKIDSLENTISHLKEVRAMLTPKVQHITNTNGEKLGIKDVILEYIKVNGPVATSDIARYLISSNVTKSKNYANALTYTRRVCSELKLKKSGTARKAVWSVR